MAFGHGAITLGSEISGGVKALTVSQCLFQKTDRGLRIKTRRGRGRECDIDNIAFDNIRMEGVLTPVVLNMWYNCVDPDGNSEYVQSREPLPVDERTPRLGKFTFTNMTCVDAEAAAAYCDGLPEQPIEAVTFENVHVRFAEDARPSPPAMFKNAEAHCRLGFYLNNVRRAVFRNVTLEGHVGEAVTGSAVDEIILEGFEEVPYV
jgi:polygalacturonase